MRTFHPPPATGWPVAPAAADGPPGGDTHHIKIDARPFALEGWLVRPSSPKGTIVLGNSSAAWRSHSPAAQLAAILHRRGFAALLLDLMGPPADDPQETPTPFETALLAARIVVANDWLVAHRDVGERPVGCLAFGSAGSSAVVAAVERPASLRAVVVVDPRLDAAEASLMSLTSPLLMITGRDDGPGACSAQRAIRSVGGRQMQIRAIAGGFGDLSRRRVREIGRLAELWYERYLRRRAGAGRIQG
jgi:dienelactone hydrolase